MTLLNCSNARNYLNPHGYGTIAVPRETIRPLLMLAKSGGRLTPVGPLASTFQAGASPLPSVSRSRMADLSGATSSNLNAEIGIDILGAAIGALAGSSLGIKAAYKKARTVTFEFGEVMENLVDITALDQFLSSATVGGNAGNFIKALLEEDEVYCIYSTVDALQISVEATAENNSSLGLDVPTVQQLVGGKVAVGSAGTSSAKITYTSTELPLPFGLKAVRLFVEDGRYTTMKMVKAKNSNLASALVEPEGSDDGVATFKLDIDS